MAVLKSPALPVKLDLQFVCPRERSSPIAMTSSLCYGSAIGRQCRITSCITKRVVGARCQDFGTNRITVADADDAAANPVRDLVPAVAVDCPMATINGAAILGSRALPDGDEVRFQGGNVLGLYEWPLKAPAPLPEGDDDLREKPRIVRRLRSIPNGDNLRVGSAGGVQF